MKSLKFLFLLFLLGTGLFFVTPKTFGQVGSPTSVPVVANGVGQPIAGATVGICASYPGASPSAACGDPITTYTDGTMSVQCTGTNKPLNNLPDPSTGSGCSNPGKSDGLGNVIAFGASGYYWCEYSGQSIIGIVVQPCPAAGVISGSAPAPPSLSIQYNNGSGSFGGSSELTFDPSSHIFASVSPDLSTGAFLAQAASVGLTGGTYGVGIVAQAGAPISIGGSQSGLGTGGGYVALHDDFTCIGNAELALSATCPSTHAPGEGGDTIANVYLGGKLNFVSIGGSLATAALGYNGSTTPNPLMLPSATGAAGTCLSTDGGDPQLLSWIGCGGGGGGGSSFNTITSGNNTSAAMGVGAGASLFPISTGQIVNTSSYIPWASQTAPSPVGTSTCVGNPFSWSQNAAGTFQTQMSIDTSAAVLNFTGTPGFVTNCRPMIFNSSGATPGFTLNGNQFNVYGLLTTSDVISTQWRFENASGDSSTYSGNNANQTYSEMFLNGTPDLSALTFVANNRVTLDDFKTGGTKPSSWAAYQAAVRKHNNYDITNCTGKFTTNGACYVGFLSQVSSQTGSNESQSGASYAAFEGYAQSDAHALSATASVFHATFTASTGNYFPTMYGFLSENVGVTANTWNFASKGVNSAGTAAGFNYFQGPTALGQATQAASGYQLDILGAVKHKAGAGVSLIDLYGSTSGQAGISVAAVAGTPATILLPTTTGSANALLSTNGSTPQQTSWTTSPTLAAATITNLTVTGTCSGCTGTFTYPSAGIAVSPGTGGPWSASLTAPASTIVGISDSQTLTNKSIAGSEINSSVVASQYGGTGQNFTASTGIIQASSGTFSASTALANGTTATTQSAADNSTKVATTAYADAVGALKLNIANSVPTGTFNGGGLTQMIHPFGAGFVSAANGEIGYDSTNKNWHLWKNGADFILAPIASGFVSGNCGQPTSSGGSWTIADSGGTCGTSSMVYPSAGVGVSSGSAWTSSLTVPSGGVTQLTGTVFSGTLAMPTAAIAAGTNSATVTVSASGTLTTDIARVGFNGNPTGITGFLPSTNGVLAIYCWPTANNVNCLYQNNTASSITLGAVTVNVQVVR